MECVAEGVTSAAGPGRGRGGHRRVPHRRGAGPRGVQAGPGRPDQPVLGLMLRAADPGRHHRLFGIANTLALSIFERTRELGLLRAVGMTRRQLRSTVRWEAVIISLFGTLLGLVIGVFFCFALQQALKDEGFNALRRAHRSRSSSSWCSAPSSA